MVEKHRFFKNRLWVPKQKDEVLDMVRIISDTSTLYSTAQAREAGCAVSPCP